MKIQALPKIVSRPQKRVGRGLGSGKGGHTVGRGQKGQKTRGKLSPLFEGTKIKKSLVKRLPLWRGKGKLKPGAKPLTLAAGQLADFPSGATVDIKSLIAAGVVDKTAEKLGVKILAGGKLEKKLTVTLPVSKGAAAQIEKAQGRLAK